MSIGNKILELRYRKKISLSTLSTLSNLSTAFLYDLENDSVPFTVDDISKIASALGMHKKDIFSQWESDYYEDFSKSKTDKEKLEMFNQFGVPEDLLDSYLSLAFDKTKDISKQNVEPNSRRPANPEPQEKTPIYKNGLFWTIVGTVSGLIQLFKK